MSPEKKPVLVWIDLEMSGLNPRVEKILEIAVVITTSDLEIIAQGPHLIVYQSDTVLDSMDDWNKKQHAESGLKERVQQSPINLEIAQKEVLACIQQYAGPGEAYLCGNSVWVDRLFLREQMPLVESYLNYRIIDVSSLKQLVAFWYPEHPLLPYKKKDTHRADQDILESLQELAFYRKHFFI